MIVRPADGTWPATGPLCRPTYSARFGTALVVDGARVRNHIGKAGDLL